MVWNASGVSLAKHLRKRKRRKEISTMRLPLGGVSNKYTFNVATCVTIL